MTRVWRTVDGDDFTCDNCGAVYSVKLTRVPMRDRDKKACEVCGVVMAEWNDTEFPSFTLIRRPEGK